MSPLLFAIVGGIISFSFVMIFNLLDRVRELEFNQIEKNRIEALERRLDANGIYE